MFRGLNLEMVTFYLGQYGFYFFFLLVFLEYLKLPIIPSGIILPATGMLLARGNSHFMLAVIVSVVAGLAGSLASYSLGYYLGKPVLDKFCSKSKGIKQVTETAQEYIERYGNKGLLIIRFIPIARTLVSVVAGTTQIKLIPFMFYSAIGIFIWNLLYMYLGYMIGNLVLQSSYI